MSEKPAGIGETRKTSYVLVREVFELPAVRKELVGRFEQILAMGGVQRVLVQKGKPIEVDRFVDAAEAPELREAPLDDLLDRVRNGRMEELPIDEKLGAPVVLLHAFARLAKLEYDPEALYTTNLASLRLWLGVEESFDLTKVYGVEARQAKEIPLDAALLVGTRDDDVLALRLPLAEFQPAGSVLPMAKGKS